MTIQRLNKTCFVILVVLLATRLLVAQEKPKVFLSDDFFLESSPPAYLWFYDQKGVLEKVHQVDGESVEIVKTLAKSCECTVVRAPDDANYVILLSRYDLVFRPRLAEKKFLVMRVDGEKLVFKGAVRRTSSIVSDSCKAIMKDWSVPSGN